MDDQNQTGAQGQQAAAGQGSQTQTNQQGQTPVIPEDLQGIAVQNDKGEVLVPLKAVQDERGKRQELEKKVKTQDEQLFLYRMNPVGTQTVQQPQQQPQGQFVQGHGQQGQQGQAQGLPLPDFLGTMDDSEMISAGELKQVIRNLQFPQNPAPNPMGDEQTQQFIGEQILNSIHGDVEHVLMGNFRGRLANPVEGPLLMQTIRNAPPILRPFIAYRIGKGESAQQAHQGAQQDVSTQAGINTGQGQQQANTQQIQANLQKPTATSAITGSAAFSAVDRIAQMSDQDFEKEIQRVKNG